MIKHGSDRFRSNINLPHLYVHSSDPPRPRHRWEVCPVLGRRSMGDRPERPTEREGPSTRLPSGARDARGPGSPNPAPPTILTWLDHGLHPQRNPERPTEAGQERMIPIRPCLASPQSGPFPVPHALGVGAAALDVGKNKEATGIEVYMYHHGSSWYQL